MGANGPLGVGGREDRGGGGVSWGPLRCRGSAGPGDRWLAASLGVCGYEVCHEAALQSSMATRGSNDIVEGEETAGVPGRSRRGGRTGLVGGLGRELGGFSVVAASRDPRWSFFHDLEISCSHVKTYQTLYCCLLS